MISIDRNIHPVIDSEDMSNFINQLKPLEIETLWEVITEHEQIQRKTNALVQLSNLLDDAEANMHELMQNYYKVQKEIENLETQLNKNV